MTLPKLSVRRVSSVACSFSSTVARICSSLRGVVGLQVAQPRFERRAHLAQARFVVARQLADALVQRRREVAQRLRVFGPRLARILVERFAQLLQARAETVDALLLLQRQAVQLLSQLAAALALLGAHDLFQSLAAALPSPRPGACDSSRASSAITIMTAASRVASRTLVIMWTSVAVVVSPIAPLHRANTFAA